MSDWKEPEWRIARKGEVVTDTEGNLGRVTKTEGTLTKRRLWIENVHGTEIYTGEDAEHFQTVSLETTNAFQTERFNLMGYQIGSLCCFRGDMNVPLEILQMDWSNLRYSMTFCLRDLREFNSPIMKTDEFTKIPLINLNLPDINSIISTEDSGLGFRINLTLSETGRTGWTVGGSVWEFNKKEDALQEVEAWKARLKIRRIASVINGDWKIEFPAWKIDLIENESGTFTKVSQVDSFNGSPAYFKTALHAAHAIKLTTHQDWKLAFCASHDYLNF